MIDAKALLTDLKKLLGRLEAGLQERVQEHAEIDEHLREEFRSAKVSGRTGQTYEPWRDEFLTQCAVAWILGTVFVRFLEDDELIETPRLSGPGERRQHALDQHTLYFQKHPTETDREYLLDVFGDVKQLPAAESVFDEKHNPLWKVGLSGDGAAELLQFWQRVNPDTGALDHDFTDEEWSTRFLGDLYQDLSESVRKKYALLQTPEFVEEFILDRTLEPAIEEFGFQEVRLIDPACGSGHFLLGAFHRLYERWVKSEPGTNPTELAQRALDQVYGVDINPYATAIAQFRLLLAALRACDVKKLARAPGFKIHLATGDSLLHGPRPGMQGARQKYLLDDDPLKHVYETEDADELKRILGQRYHTVVGNPPYITVKDKALNAAYRERFGTCYRQYSLAVPFLERFFDLALSPDAGTKGAAGYVGTITANSFMKREFGKKLIEEFIPRWDLTHVVDTSGAYIPGHGTPTVILFARSQPPVGEHVRAVMGIRGEPKTPDDPAKGLVWSAILKQIDEPGSESDYVSVIDAERKTLQNHPWSLTGGGAAQLKKFIDEKAERVLFDIVSSVGFYQDTHADEAFVQPLDFVSRHKLKSGFRPQVRGEQVRDWSMECTEAILFPYDKDLDLWHDIPRQPQWAWLYALKTNLWSRSTFGGSTYKSGGKKWFEFHQFPKDRARTPLSIAFAFVATHNHFVLDRGGKVFNRSAPVIKLPPDATEDDHLALLGLLNSSTACFWMKQVFHGKGGGGIGGGLATEEWERFFEFDGTKIKQFPIPRQSLGELSKRLDQTAHSLVEALPGAFRADQVLDAATLSARKDKAQALRKKMIALQEELDWRSYSVFGLTEKDLCYESDELPAIELGQRASDIVLARRLARGQVETVWFDRHECKRTNNIPSEWPQDYRALVERRILEIENNPGIQLIETPEFKRRWASESWDELQKRALRDWLLARLESSRHWVVARMTTCAVLADRVSRDGDFMQVGELYRGTREFDPLTLVTELISETSVPCAAVLRYSVGGLRKREMWERTWHLQRLEDAIESRTALPEGLPERLTAEESEKLKRREVGNVPAPPKYKPADYAQSLYWRLRGKLDVPKERFISFPYCERAADPSPVILWAGFNHLQQAQAIASYYLEMKEQEGWQPDRLMPLLTGLLELVPWVKQWHNEPDAEHGERMGDYFESFVHEEARALGVTLDDIRGWTPPKKKKSKKTGKKRSKVAG